MLRRLFTAIIRAYQYCISPFLPPSCRYYPSCSAYAIEAIETHGALRGSGYALHRILRCNPFSHGGHDPVPPAADHKCCAQSNSQVHLHD